MVGNAPHASLGLKPQDGQHTRYMYVRCSLINGGLKPSAHHCAICNTSTIIAYHEARYIHLMSVNSGISDTAHGDPSVMYLKYRHVLCDERETMAGGTVSPCMLESSY